MKLAILSALSVAVFLAAPANADDIPPCAVPKGVTATPLLSDAPKALRDELWSQYGDIVPAGEGFDATDVVGTGKDRRLIFLWSLGRRWIVASEHGGIAYNDPIFAYDLSEDGQQVSLVKMQLAFPESVCQVANELLKAKSP